MSKRGKDDTQIHRLGQSSTSRVCPRQRYECRDCLKQFDDLTGTIFAGRHQGLKVWMLCLYFMGLNLSNRQIADELELNKDDVQNMTRQLRKGILEQSPAPTLKGTVEMDEVYVVAGHKGQPEAVQKKGDLDAETDSKAQEDEAL